MNNETKKLIEYKNVSAAVLVVPSVLVFLVFSPKKKYNKKDLGLSKLQPEYKKVERDEDFSSGR